MTLFKKLKFKQIIVNSIYFQVLFKISLFSKLENCSRFSWLRSEAWACNYSLHYWNLEFCKAFSTIVLWIILGEKQNWCQYSPQINCKYPSTNISGPLYGLQVIWLSLLDLSFSSHHFIFLKYLKNDTVGTLWHNSPILTCFDWVNVCIM